MHVGALHVRVPSKEEGMCILQLRVVKMESCVKLFVDTAVMSTALKALQSSRIGRHTRAPMCQPTARRIADALHIEVSPMPPRGSPAYV